VLPTRPGKPLPAKFDLESTVLPGFVPTASGRNANRQQLIAGPVAASIDTPYAEYLQNASSMLIGSNSADMYPLSEHWQLCFGPASGRNPKCGGLDGAHEPTFHKKAHRLRLPM
jgi:hypothetical protein